MSPGSTTRPEIPFARLEPKLASFPGGNELHQPARGQRCSERSPSSPPTGVTHQDTLLNQAPLNGHASLSFIHHAHICRGFTCAQLIHGPSSASTVGTLTGYQMENHENTTPCSRTAMLYIFLPPHCVSRCQRLQETVMLRWPARALSVFPFIIMRSLRLHWHVVPTQTHGPFLKAHQNFKLTRATTKWKHEVKNTTPSAADGQTPALLQHLLRLLLFVQSLPEALLDEFSAPSWLYVGAAWRRSDSSAWSTRQSWRGNDH